MNKMNLKIDNRYSSLAHQGLRFDLSKQRSMFKTFSEANFAFVMLFASGNQSLGIAPRCLRGFWEERKCLTL